MRQEFSLLEAEQTLVKVQNILVEPATARVSSHVSQGETLNWVSISYNDHIVCVLTCHEDWQNFCGLMLLVMTDRLTDSEVPSVV